jgi:hypothetical protein
MSSFRRRSFSDRPSSSLPFLESAAPGCWVSVASDASRSPEIAKFHVYSLMISEFDLETGSHQTASSAIQSSQAATPRAGWVTHCVSVRANQVSIRTATTLLLDCLRPKQAMHRSDSPNSSLIPCCLLKHKRREKEQANSIVGPCLDSRHRNCSEQLR